MTINADSPSTLFREAVRVEIERINQRAGGRTAPAKHAGRDGYGPYDGTHALNLRWLAELISRRMNRSLTSGEIYSLLRKNSRALPRDLDVRQELLEHTQDTLADCAHLTGREPSDADLVELCLGTAASAPTLAPFGFEAEELGFFRISSWNPNRPMTETKRHIGKIQMVPDRADELARHEQTENWIRDRDLYDRLLAKAQAESMGSPCPALVGYEADEREQDPASHQLKLTVSETRYSYHVALRNYLRADHEAYDAVKRRIVERTYAQGRSEALSHVIRSAPESNIVINVTVQSRNNQIMLIRRPRKATVWAAFYQAGAHETMNWPGPEEKVENWYELARRALDEEIGIKDPSDYYNKIVFSWFGFYAPEASGYFFAHVRTRLNERQLIKAVAGAKGSVEAERIEWLALDKGSIRSVLKTWANGTWEDEARVDELGRSWLPHATMSLTQLWQVTQQGMLETPAERAEREAWEARR